MLSRLVVLVVPVALFLAAPSRAADAARIARLIDQLGSERFDDREEAFRALERLGPPALEALRQAAANKDLEIARRAADLAARAACRLATARTLDAGRIRLEYKDRPVPEVVADFASRTGYPLQLDDKDRARLAQRTITLDTGEVSFWEALEQLCGKAGLVEEGLRDPTKYPPPLIPNLGRKQNVVSRSPYLADDSFGLQAALILADGKQPTPPTHVIGALRIRALSPGHPHRDHLPQPGDTHLVLDVAPGPGLGWHSLVSVRVDKAIDDRGQRLVQRGASLGGAGLDGDDEIRFLLAEQVGVTSAPGPGYRHQIPVRLKLGALPSKQVKELHGTLAAEVLTPPGPLMVIDDVVKAAGRSVRGEEGGLLTVAEASREAEGRVRLKVRLETPPPPQSWRRFGAAALLNGQVLAQRRLLFQGDDRADTPPSELILLDAKGEVIPRREGRGTGKGVGTAHEYELTFQPRPGQSEPARLVYNGRRLVVIEVPFTLKDVPLP